MGIFNFFFYFSKGAAVFVEGEGPVPWHSGLSKFVTTLM